MQHKQGISLGAEYQGLNPSSCFILSSKGFPYSLKAKHRTAHDGTIKTYYTADSVEFLIRTIYQKTGIKKASSHSGRRSLASKLNASNVSLQTIARTLGHREIQTTLLYIEIAPKQLEKGAELAL
ncbi:TPA: tyrosine-type recombinase/integrase [Vibrio parahaemolyticus]|nr:tyrosine-type recombinase/integrase [Vibrio parahaemolyticus]HBC3892484.1 tyrosine-type recombinase/integrase [Vibrio parahaemolyticus]